MFEHSTASHRELSLRMGSDTPCIAQRSLPIRSQQSYVCRVSPEFAAKLACIPWTAQSGCSASPREVSPISGRYRSPRPPQRVSPLFRSMLDFQSPASYALLEPRIQRDARYTTYRVTPTKFRRLSGETHQRITSWMGTSGLRLPSERCVTRRAACGLRRLLPPVPEFWR